MNDSLIKQILSWTDQPEPDAVKIVDALLQSAVDEKASDLYITPNNEHLSVRLRIEGHYRELLNLPNSVRDQLTARLKVLARCQSHEFRRPQEGRIQSLNGKTLDIRASFLPALHGERIVLRVLRGEMELRPLDALGWTPEQLKLYISLLHPIDGAILFTGPAGSGKSTTIYATLRHLEATEGKYLNFATLEDPIEYDLRTIAQTQIAPAVGLDFAAGLRSMLRQDPNVIMIGEIRDTETAATAMRAAMSGHLILSTVHARDTLGVSIRLIDMGVEPFIVASSIRVVAAQRLVGLNCPKCSKQVPLDPYLAEYFRLDKNQAVFQGQGCEVCGQTGIMERRALFELFIPGDNFQQAVTERTPLFELRKLFQPRPSLKDSAAVLIKEGFLSPLEAGRVL